jgi:hypothetical protein
VLNSIVEYIVSTAPVHPISSSIWSLASMQASTIGFRCHCFLNPELLVAAGDIVILLQFVGLSIASSSGKNGRPLYSAICPI